MGIAEDLESPQCVTCRHKDEGDLICSAFPFGIPAEVYQNIVLHDKVLDEQIGDYLYEKI